MNQRTEKRSRPPLEVPTPEDLAHNGISGTVKFFNDSKGFGFVTPKDGGKDIFLHTSVAQECGYKPQKGDAVIVMKRPSQKGEEVSYIVQED